MERARFGRMLDAVRAGGSGVSAKYLGPVQRPEVAGPLEGVECLFPPGREPEIPDGGRRLVYFDPATHFPVLSLTYDSGGREVDFYCFDRFQLDVKLDDDDFNPDNDPYSEHDFGSFEIGHYHFVFKIDYYDKECIGGSEDPADFEKTTRVLTFMLREDY